MSNEVIGVVQEVYDNGVGKGSGIRVGGLKYGVYDPAKSGMAGISEGDQVSFVFKDAGKYKNIQGKITKTSGGLADTPTPTVAANTGGKRWRNNGEEGGFPIHQRAYERALDRRNALNASTAFWAMQDVVPTINDILTVAKDFEDYTTGGEIAAAEAALAFSEGIDNTDLN